MSALNPDLFGPRNGGFAVEDVNLATLASATRQKVDRGGCGLYYSPRGSARGGLLRLVLAGGGELQDFGPGDRVIARFESFEVISHASSAGIGTARLVILQAPNVDLESDAGEPGLGQPTDLLGVSGESGAARAFIAVVEDTVPAGANPVGSFDVSGWKTVRVLIDGNPNAAAGNADTFDLVPWSSPRKNTEWYEQGLQRVSVPITSQGSGQSERYREVILDVRGRGQLYLEINNLAPAANTQLGFIVQGID